ncbi:putative major pilin subunit [Anaerohalosphaera lusitana]|uniref:Putative major pilin subunit n=1 Tax=Anaerohalosphaera lusitana TaxID=1936003 RepID=A0A1U9NKF3_9BACT|nr:type II secretion system protein [Anaerohalosphaera lusitana]AQT68070.1 putative major pilin subunit [Anaerohalosphaera lusitana]
MRKKGFTLIELLVVIAIIALLMAIMLPALGMVKEKARTVLCASNQKQTGLILFTYATDNEQEIPEPVMWERVSQGSGWTTWGDRMFYEFNYMDMTEQLYCPSTKVPPECTKKWDPDLTPEDFWNAGHFEWSGLRTFGLRVPVFDQATDTPIRLNQIKRPSNHYLLTDCSHEIEGGQMIASEKYQYYLFDYYHSFFMLHSAGANVLMADGSVSRKRETEIASDIKRGVIGPFLNDPFIYPSGETKRLEDVLN